VALRRAFGSDAKWQPGSKRRADTALSIKHAWKRKSRLCHDDHVGATRFLLIGAGVMTLTSYFGHRFFTYDTFHRIGPS
jgi:hypothetical protein